MINDLRSQVPVGHHRHKSGVFSLIFDSPERGLIMVSTVAISASIQAVPRWSVIRTLYTVQVIVGLLL